jgi:hypothetical protein
MVLQHGSGTTDWILPEYQSGLAGYELWIRALEDGRAVALGMAYNAAVWAECRGYAVQFLRQAGQRLSAHKLLFQKAARSYAVVARQLSAVSERYPFSFDLGMEAAPVDERSRAAVRSLRSARRAEGVGLEILAEIVQALSH